MPVFLTVIISTLIYIGFQLSADLSHVPALNLYSLILLATALFIALGFEFVNGFHDTANAVATVIYTNALSAPVAVMWAGFCNFLGVMVASGAVAYGIIALLPVELIMNVSSGAGFAMVFAMLIAAILWNLGTWFLGIPASSSHILIGIVPLAYSLNKNLDSQHIQSFAQLSDQTAAVIYQNHNDIADEKARTVITQYIQTKEMTPEVVPALASLTDHLGERVGHYGDLKDIPEAEVSALRNDMYLSTTAFKRLDKADQLPAMSEAGKKTVKEYRSNLDSFLQYIPTWVKVAVALALGLGTMVGWKRIVVTVGERIGKNHMTYGQGMSAELVAMTTIAAADGFGMPVSTTHVLNSAVAGTMVANKSGLNFATVRTILSAWIFTLPATICLSGGLFWLFLQFV